MLLKILQLPLPDVPRVAGDDVNAILVWVIGFLFVMASIALGYLRIELVAVRKELKEERAYIRNENEKNSKMVSDTLNVLEQLTKITDKSHENIGGIKQLIVVDVAPIIKDSNDRLKDIKSNSKN